MTAASATRGFFAAIGRYLRSLWICLLLLLLAIVGILGWAVMSLCLVTTPIVVGGLALIVVMPLTHQLAGLARRLSGWVLGRPVLAAAPRNTERTMAGRAQLILADSTTWRVWLWLTFQWVAVIVTPVLALIPVLNTLWCKVQAHLISGLLGFGHRSAEPAAGSRSEGHGLIGMAERVDMLGGTLRTGPTEDGGFAVRVTIPLPTRDDVQP